MTGKLDPAYRIDEALKALNVARTWMPEVGSTISAHTVLGHLRTARAELDAAMTLLEMSGR